MQFDWNLPSSIVIKPEQADLNVPYAAGSPGLGGIPLSHFENRQEEKEKILKVVYKNDRWCCPLCQKSFTLKFTLQRHLMGGLHQKDDPQVMEWLKKMKVITSKRQRHFENEKEVEKRKILEVVYKDDRWCCPLCQKSFTLKFTLQRHLLGGLHDQNDPKVKEWSQKISGRLSSIGRGPARPKEIYKQFTSKFFVGEGHGNKSGVVSLPRQGFVPPPSVSIVQPYVAVELDSPESPSQPKREITQMSYL